jgi:glycosyltransferase involved in cell wall biosynthesis
MARTILYLQGITEIGGAERALLSVLERLDRTCWQPVVACPFSGPLVTELKSMGVLTYPMKFPAWRKLTHVLSRVPAWLKLARLVQAIRPALVHVNDLYWVPQAMLATRRQNIPVVVTVRQNLKMARVRQYRLDKAAFLVTVSDAARDVLIKSGVRADRVRRIYTGVDINRLSPEYDGSRVREQLGIPNGASVLGCLANVLEIKGHDILLHAFANVVKVHPTSHVLLVGRDTSSYGAEMRALANRLGVAERTHFVGFQPDVRPYLAAMNLVVLPSRSEALGLALLEAMAMGKVVVASAVGGIPEIVADGVTGKLVPPEDPAALSMAIIELLSHPERLIEGGRQGRKRIQSAFTVEAETQALESIYHFLLKDESSTDSETSTRPAFVRGA